MTVIILLFVIVAQSVAQICDYDSSVELTNRTHNGIRYEDGEYFVDNTTGVERGCVCMKEKCVRKCCPIGQGYDSVKRRCEDLQEAFDPPIWDLSELIPRSNAMKEFHVVTNTVICSSANDEFRALLRVSPPEYHLKTDGKFYMLLEGNKYKAFGLDKYCLDNFFLENNETKTKTVQLKAFICFKHETVDLSKYIISSSCMLISCFFMALTIAVYTLVPALRTLHGMVLITYLMSFFVAFLCMVIMQLSLYREFITLVACTSLTFVIYFAILAAFFWLNVMCYNLWSKLRPQRNGASKSKRRFLRYCAYAFGVPSLLTVLMAVLEFSGLPQNNRYLPRIRLQGCFLSGFSKLLYLYLPMMIICAANLVLFILIARRISALKKRAQQLKIKETQRFTLYIELFIVTGLSWVFEVISSIYPGIDILWQIIDIYNCLVGVFIFIIFVCKKKIFVLISERYMELTGTPQQRKQTSTTSSRSTTRSKEDIPMYTDTLLE